MSTQRVLLLEDDTTLAIELGRRGFSIEIVGLGPHDLADDGFYAPCDKGRQLAAGATRDQYDCVVIGNYLGAGLTYARLLPPDMHERTVVVWSVAVSASSGAYRALGITHVCSRHQMLDPIEEILKTVRT